MKTSRYTLLLTEANGQPIATGAGSALLLGMSYAELATHCDPETDYESLPRHLQQLGQRRAREGQAASGSRSVVGVFTYWAMRDFGDDVLGFDFDITTHAIYLISGIETAMRLAPAANDG